MSEHCVLALRGVSKRYGPVRANHDVTVEIQAGEIHAVVGENGSGKSTLLGVASGTVVPDEGTVHIDGQPLRAAKANEAMRLGLGMAYQTMTEVVGLTVAENLYLAAPATKRPRYGQMTPWAQEILDAAELGIVAADDTGDLTIAQRQMLEVVHAQLCDPKVLLLDEPTTALSHHDVDRLHAVIQKLADGGIGIVYVSHRLQEVLGVADRVTVMRDGVAQGTFDAADLSEDDVVALMIGRPLAHAFPAVPTADDRQQASTILEVSQLRGRRFGAVDLALGEGEVLGIAGAAGNGQLELIRALAGVEPSNGSVACRGQPVDLRSPSGPLRAGIVLLSADRKAESVFTALGVRANATLQVLARFARLGFVSRRREGTAVERLVGLLRLKAASVEEPVQYLSGGNQQKVALMRPFLKGDLSVILADEPTQGVDVGARLDIYRALRDRASEGSAVIVKSSDPIELAGLCDRVLVMSRGRFVEEIPRAELDERRIIAAIVAESVTVTAGAAEAAGTGDGA